jgi:hypothetical protein
MTMVKEGFMGTLVNERFMANMACPNKESTLSMDAIGRTWNAGHNNV